VLLADGSVLVATTRATLQWIEGVLDRRTVELPGMPVLEPRELGDGLVAVVVDDVLVAIREGAEAFRLEGVEAVAAVQDGLVTVGESGICWRDVRGTVARCASFAGTASAHPAVGPTGQVFVPTESGALVVVSAQGEVERTVTVARTALWTPVMDEDRGQVLAAAGDGVVGAVALDPGGDR
jgi:hypothetical protein